MVGWNRPLADPQCAVMLGSGREWSASQQATDDAAAEAKACCAEEAGWGMQLWQRR